ncbi:MAG: hypothetical protein C5B55_11210 [Blastocatellia bacterium]|nr:MAG: hypothetical protein C5B55_11210 [Blastocatellia bacterium]
MIGKAVALSEAIARSDRGPLPKIKEMVKGFQVEHVGEEVTRAFDKMQAEIARVSTESHKKAQDHWTGFRRRKTPAERREQHITHGVVSLFSGVGAMVFLYYLSAAIVLKLPPDVIAKIPFELEPVIRVIWLLGLVPLLSGVGHIAAGLLIRPAREREALPSPHTQRDIGGTQPDIPPAPANLKNVVPSVTEHTTELLSDASWREH